MKIAVTGIGYVGLANAVLFAKNHDVNIFDTDNQKLDMIENHVSPVKDDEICKILRDGLPNLKVCRSLVQACNDADFVLIAISANYNSDINKIDTTALDKLISEILKIKSNCKIVIKSTVYVGFINDMCSKYSTDQIYFSPEFLREGKAYYDCLNANRIVIGCNNVNKDNEFAAQYVDLFAKICNGNSDKYIVQACEAEAAKLFANSYLAMRIAYFNELDTFAEKLGLNSKNIIDIVSGDFRIGNYYNNPSFGYGGYCLPKDTKELSSEMNSVLDDSCLINYVDKSNKLRNKFVVNQIIKFTKNICDNEIPVIGIYKLTMKIGSDNFRNSSMLNIIESLKKLNYKILIFEDLIDNDDFILDCKVCADIEQFKQISDVIIANRYSCQLDDVKSKVYTRDIFHNG